MKYKLEYKGRFNESGFKEYGFDLDTEKSNINFYVLEDLSGIRFDRDGDSMEALKDLGKLLNLKGFNDKLKSYIILNKPRTKEFEGEEIEEGDCSRCGMTLECAKNCGGHSDDKTATCPQCGWKDN